MGSNAQAVANELWVDFEDDLPLDEQEALVALLSEEGASPLQILAPVHQAARLDEVEADPTLKGPPAAASCCSPSGERWGRRCSASSSRW